MSVKFLLQIAPLAVVLSACAPAPIEPVVDTDNPNLPGAGGAADDPQGSLGGMELCDAADYRPLIGQPYTDTSYPTGPNFRIYSDTALVTQEYLPSRTNVVFDVKTGLILRAFCG